MAFVEGQHWQRAFKADGGNQNIFDADIFVAANQLSMQVSGPAGGSIVKRRDFHHAQQRVFANQLFDRATPKSSSYTVIAVT